VDKDKNPSKTGAEVPQGKQGKEAAEGAVSPEGTPESGAKPSQSGPDSGQPAQDKALQDKARQEEAPLDKQNDYKSSQSSPAENKAEQKASPAGKPKAEKAVTMPDSSSAAVVSSAASTSKPPPQERGTPRKGGRGKWVVLLVLIALAAGGYYLWPQYGDRILALAGVGASEDTAQSQPPQTVSLTGEQGAEDGSEGPAELAAQDSESSLVVDPATSELIDQERSARQEMATELRDQMADLELRLNSHADRLRQLSTTSRDDWLLAEAEYLLRLASQRLLTERQTTNAAALMESADVILRDMSDPALYPVRKALAENITQIRLANPVDREGIFLRIGALADAVDSLNSLLPDTAVVTEVTEAAEPTSWYGRLWGNVRQAARNMVGLIRVERRDVPLQPLLTLEQEQVLRYNLKVVLEQARLALLREEQVIYADSLSRASSWVAEHFAEDARTAAFMAELEQLAAQSVSQELPSVTPSLQALQAYIRLWHNRHDPGAAPGASGDVQDGSESP